MVLPSPVSWVPDVRPSSEEETPEKTPPGTAFRPDWETQFTGGKASEPPAEKKRQLLYQMVLVVKNPPASAGDMRDSGTIPGLGRASREGNGTPLHYSC